MPTARMNKSSSALRLAATGWLVSRQCTRSAPSSFVPVGSVPGIRLENVQNALRCAALRQTQRANDEPGLQLQVRIERPPRDIRSRHRRLAQKTRRERASDPNLSRDPCGGRRRKLTQVAPTTAASPTGRSAGAHPEIMSQNARRSVARTAHTRGRPTGTFSDCGLNAPIQNWNRLRRAAAQRPRYEVAAPLLMLIAQPARHLRSQAPRLRLRQSYHDSFERGKRQWRAPGGGSNPTKGL